MLKEKRRGVCGRQTRAKPNANSDRSDTEGYVPHWVKPFTLSAPIGLRQIWVGAWLCSLLVFVWRLPDGWATSTVFVSDKRVSYLIGMQPSYLSCSGHWALQLHWFSMCIANFIFCHCFFNIDPVLMFLERVFLPRTFTKNFSVGRQNNPPFFHLESSVEECGKVMLSLGLEKSHATDTNCVTRLSVSHY